jgi:nitrogen fixation-related uncharacterized protein
MSNAALFALGAVVTLLVGAALVLLVWGAILDGRYDDEQRAARDAAGPSGEREALRALESA